MFTENGFPQAILGINADNDTQHRENKRPSTAYSLRSKTPLSGSISLNFPPTHVLSVRTASRTPKPKAIGDGNEIKRLRKTDKVWVYRARSCPRKHEHWYRGKDWIGTTRKEQGSSQHMGLLVNGCRERRLRRPILQRLFALSFSDNRNSEVTMANRNEATHPRLLKERVLKSLYSLSVRGPF